MGMYESYGMNRYNIDKKEYNYLLPIYGTCAKDNGFSKVAYITCIDNKFYFIGSKFDYEEMKERCKYL